MTIETNFKRGDRVFYMDNNAVASAIVDSVTVNVTAGPRSPSGDNDDRVNIVYGFARGNQPGLGQSRVFASKEALLASL